MAMAGFFSLLFCRSSWVFNIAISHTINACRKEKIGKNECEQTESFYAIGQSRDCFYINRNEHSGRIKKRTLSQWPIIIVRLAQRWKRIFEYG